MAAEDQVFEIFQDHLLSIFEKVTAISIYFYFIFLEFRFIKAQNQLELQNIRKIDAEACKKLWFDQELNLPYPYYAQGF